MPAPTITPTRTPTITPGVRPRPYIDPKTVRAPQTHCPQQKREQAWEAV